MRGGLKIRTVTYDGRVGWRQSRGSAFAGRTGTCQAGCRQGPRFERDPAPSGIGRHSSPHPQSRPGARVGISHRELAISLSLELFPDLIEGSHLLA